ncbi:MAG: BrnA antitoxin family protein [Panacagrimonas sp.]
MRKDYDFTKAKRGAVISAKGKTRITIMLDNDVIAAFREQAEEKGVGYQTAINEALRNALLAHDGPLTAKQLRQILRQELRAA